LVTAFGSVWESIYGPIGYRLLVIITLYLSLWSLDFPLIQTLPASLRNSDQSLVYAFPVQLHRKTLPGFIGLIREDTKKALVLLNKYNLRPGKTTSLSHTYGHTNQGYSQGLYISVRTVKFHISNLLPSRHKKQMELITLFSRSITGLHITLKVTGGFQEKSVVQFYPRCPGNK
jgi:hypothetical protein